MSGTAAAQTVTWGGGFPNDNFGTASNWIGGALPLNDGTEILQFTDQSSGVMKLNAPALFLGVLIRDNGENNNGEYADITGTNSLTLFSAGVTVISEFEAYSDTLVFDVPVVLASNQVWSQVQNSFGGAIVANGAISGNYSLTLLGDGNVDEAISETFALTSANSTFTGGVTVMGNGTTLVVGASSTGSPGAVTAGPVGTGTLVLGDGTTLTTTTGSLVTLANALTLGDQTTGASIVYGGSTSQYNPGRTLLTLSGPVLLNDADLELDAAPNSIVTFSGNMAGYNPSVCLDFGGTGSGSSIFIVQGNISNVARLDIEDPVTLILDAPAADLAGTGTTQIASVEDIGTVPNAYLGMGSGYAAAGNVGGFISWLNSTGSAANFQGTLGFDTTSGAPALFDTDNINLAHFTNAGFVGLGSATSAILGPNITITPPGTTYLFGGGGGTLEVRSPLTDAPGVGTGLTLSAGNAPLTLILQGTVTYTGTTSVSGAALIFDTALPTGPFSLSGAYVGSTLNSGYADDGLYTIQSFVNLFTTESGGGVVGFDSLTGPRTVTSDIDMTGLNLYLGTASPDGVTFSGTITPNNQQYMFAAVKGGRMTVSSVLSDLIPGSLSDSAVIGLQNNPVSFFAVANRTSGPSSVTLSGVNTYSGGTTLNSGILFVTNDSSIGTGPLFVPGAQSGGPQWVATLAAAVNPVTLANNIYIPNGGLALNTGSANALTLTGTIANELDDEGTLGIFGPVTLSGDNSYNNTTIIQGTTVTSTNDWAFGNSQLVANSSTLNFTSASPQLLYGVQFSNVIANFTSATGSPVLGSVSLFESTLNFNGASAEIDGLFSDAPGSGNAISLASGTALKINLEGGEDGSPSFHGIISGGGSLFVTGGSSLDLRAANTYTGGTAIDTSTLVIASNNSALGTGGVSINGGALVTNTGVTLTNPVSFGANGGGLAGFGTFSPGGNITFGANELVDAGSAKLGGSVSGAGSVPRPGLLTFAGGTSLTFGPGGGLLFAIADANGGAGTGYGTIDVAGSGTLTLSATSLNPFDIQIYSFGPAANLPGPANNFNPALPYSWTLLTASSISGFNANAFIVDPTNFLNPLGQGTFSVSQSGGDLVLNFTPVPEPSTWALMASGLCALGAAVRRRRR